MLLLNHLLSKLKKISYCSIIVQITPKILMKLFLLVEKRNMHHHLNFMAHQTGLKKVQ